MVGVEHGVTNSGEHRRKGTVDFARLRTPFLDSFYQNDPHTQALLVGYLWVPGVASSGEFMLDTGGYCELVARIERVGGQLSERRGIRFLW
jgi:hypothetical protein